MSNDIVLDASSTVETTVKDSKSVDIETLEALKGMLSDALLADQLFQAGEIDLTQTARIMDQANAATDPNTRMMLTTMFSVMSSNAVLQSSNEALQSQIAAKDRLIAQCLSVIESIVPTA